MQIGFLVVAEQVEEVRPDPENGMRLRKPDLYGAMRLNAQNTAAVSLIFKSCLLLAATANRLNRNAAAGYVRAANFSDTEFMQ